MLKLKGKMKKENKKEFITKEDLERTYHKEKGYYDDYDWFEDLICNVCGKILYNDGEEIGEIEQDFINENTITFCPECAKLPNKKELVKIPKKCCEWCEGI